MYFELDIIWSDYGLIKKSFSTVDDYIASFPKQVQSKLKTVRRTIRNAVPDAEESISYNMPGYKYQGRRLVYFAAFNDHYSLFAATYLPDKFKKQLAHYKVGRGTIQFLYDQPVPVKLIRDIAKYRASENLQSYKKRTR